MVAELKSEQQLSQELGKSKVKLHAAKRARRDARANRAVMQDAFDAVGPDSVPAQVNLLPGGLRLTPKHN